MNSAAAQPAAQEYQIIPHETRKKQFQEAMDQTEKGRKASEQDRDYRDHKQWSAYELQKLRKRNQPPIVKNRIARKVDTLIGIQERSASDPRAYPRTPNDEDSADVVTDSLRYVCDKNRFKHIQSKVIENIIVEGTGGVEIIVEQRGKVIDVVLNRLRWETIFADPYSREEDFSDAKYMGAAIWMDLDVVGKMYGEKAKAVAEASLSTNSMVSGSMEDRPRSMSSMTDKKNRRVVVVDMYQQCANGWDRYVFCSGGDLLPGGPSPYLDEDGKPVCPIELASLYVDRENQRYGLVRGMLGAQDEINYRTSKMLHLSSTRQTFSNKMSGVDVSKVKGEMSRPDGHVEMESGEFGRDFGVIPTNDMFQGQAELLQEAKAEIDILGPNQSLRGQGSDTQSGRAWEAQQQAGLAELSVLYAAMNDLSLRVYRQIWMRIRQYWTTQMYIRVTDNSDAPKFLTINEPEVDQMGQPMIDPMTGQPRLKNRPSQMDVDIIVDTSPDVMNAMQEQYEMLIKLRELGEPIPATAIIEASNLRNKRQILDHIKQAQSQPPQPNPVDVAKIEQGKEKLRQTNITTVTDAMKTMADIHKNSHDMHVAEQQLMQPPAGMLQ